MSVTLPLQLILAFTLQLLILAMTAMVYYYDRKSEANRAFVVLMLVFAAWTVTGVGYMYFPVPTSLWVVLQMTAGIFLGPTFYFFALHLSVPRYRPGKATVWLWLPALYLTVVGAFRIFDPASAAAFAAKVAVTDQTLSRDFDVHYLVYTLGIFGEVALGLITMVRWMPKQTDAGKRQRLVTIFWALLILAVLLFVFNSLASVLGLPHDPNLSMVAFTVSMILVAFSLMRDKAWKVETLLGIIQKREAELAAEKAKSDQLLLNILPAEVAEELKASGKVTPVSYDSASVLFTDFAGFSQLAEGLSPRELVAELDRYFSAFDAVMEKFGVEKLKTIGDSYMGAGGLPAPNATHAVDTILAALAIQAFMVDQPWKLRLGIHTGPLAAGIIGEKKFVYDIWGDTVNVASRMESSGVVGQVNVSATTQKLAESFFLFEARGEVQAKNKGTLAMSLVKGIRPELSEGGNGLVPNQEFRKAYATLAAVTL